MDNLQVIRVGDTFAVIDRNWTLIAGGFGCSDDAMIWMYRHCIQEQVTLAAGDTRGDAEEAEYLLLEGRDSNPAYQSNDLDQELADAQLGTVRLDTWQQQDRAPAVVSRRQRGVVVMEYLNVNGNETYQEQEVENAIDTPDWSAVEENMALITGIELAVRQLVNVLPLHIRDALGWVEPGVTPVYKVYLLAIGTHDDVETLGVYISIEAAKRAAEKRAGEVLTWEGNTENLSSQWDERHEPYHVQEWDVEGDDNDHF